MTPVPPTEQEKLFIRVVKLSTAFSLGCMAAFLHSVREVNPKLRFEVSWLTGIWFLAGAGFSRLLWKLLPLETARRDAPASVTKGKMLRAVLLSLVMTVGLVAAFAYGLKDVAREKLPEIAVGTTLALAFLTTAGGMLFAVGRYFERDR